MPVIRYGAPLNVLVAAKGHPYERDAFMGIFEGMDGIAASLVEQPAAARLMNPEGMAGFDILALYDMPGLDFAAKPCPGFVEPDDAFKAGFRALLDHGKGVLALHHAIAGWPAWPEYAELLGGRFLYQPQVLRGRERPDSGYRHEVTHQVEILDPGDPIAAGLPRRFTLTDELYLFEVFEDLVTPLLRSDAAFTRENFHSAAAAVAGRTLFECGLGPPARLEPDRLGQAGAPKPAHLPPTRRRPAHLRRAKLSAPGRECPAVARLSGGA